MAPASKEKKAEKCCDLLGRWYIAGFGGINAGANGHGSISDTVGAGSSAPTDVGSSDASGTTGFKVGYEFAPFAHSGSVAWLPALELEGSYANTTFDTETTFPLIALPGRVTADFDTWSVMLNALLKAKINDRWEPYIGLGVGVSYIGRSGVTSRVDIIPAAFPMNADDDVVLSMQAIAGCDFFLDQANNWSVFMEYKFLVSFDPTFDDQLGFIPGLTNEMQYDWLGQHLVTVGLRYRF